MFDIYTLNQTIYIGIHHHNTNNNNNKHIQWFSFCLLCLSTRMSVAYICLYIESFLPMWCDSVCDGRIYIVIAFSWRLNRGEHLWIRDVEGLHLSLSLNVDGSDVMNSREVPVEDSHTHTHIYLPTLAWCCISSIEFFPIPSIHIYSLFIHPFIMLVYMIQPKQSLPLFSCELYNRNVWVSLSLPTCVNSIVCVCVCVCVSEV